MRPRVGTEHDSMMALGEALNFIVTNRIPRRLATRFMGWFARIEQPLVSRLSIATWRAFADLELADARKSKFKSLRDCFTRELKPGARTIDTDAAVLASPCDAIVGACGEVRGTEVLQVKGLPYRLEELIPDAGLIEHFRDGQYATLRLTASMYHRFHAPYACNIDAVLHIDGDTWNVNPPALARVDRLFCRNERAVLSMRIATGHRLLLVPVAAILVAGIRLHFLPALRSATQRGAKHYWCNASFAKGEELGWFEHGSTILVFAPRGLTLAPGIGEGVLIRMGQCLMRVE